MKLDGFFERIGISVQLELLRMLGSSEQSYRYTFMSVEQFRDLTKVEQSRVYWYEMVERAHCASLTSLLRLQRWVALINSSAEGLNFVGFAASFRGVIESAADTRYALAVVPRTLALFFPIVAEAIRGESKKGALLVPELESHLIHFSFGRKWPKGEEPTDETHVAKTMHEYLNTLEGGTTGPIHECYAELCNITHPAADSVLYLLEQKKRDLVIFRSSADKKAIQDLRKRWGNALAYAVSDSMLYPVMTLKIVNRFGLPELGTPAVELVSLENSPIWQDLERQLSLGAAFDTKRRRARTI